MNLKFSLILFILLAACVPATSIPSVTPAPPPTIFFTPIPTFTPIPQPSPTPLFQVENEGQSLVYDFTAHVCEARWMNSVKGGLPCPGDINNPASGYVGLLSGSDQGLAPDFPMILTMPASLNAGGIFGRFPKIKVGLDDIFRTSFACRSDAACDVEFTLAFYDANGTYQENFPAIHHRQGEPPINFTWSLSGLAGQTVEFVLVVRATYQSDPMEAWALWIAPRILKP